MPSFAIDDSLVFCVDCKVLPPFKRTGHNVGCLVCPKYREMMDCWNKCAFPNSHDTTCLTCEKHKKWVANGG